MKQRFWAVPLIAVILLGIGCLVMRGSGTWLEGGTCYNTYSAGVWGGRIYISHDSTDGLDLPSKINLTIRHLSLAPKDRFDDSIATEWCGVTYISWTDPSRTFVDSSSSLLIPFPYVAVVFGIASLLLRRRMREAPVDANFLKIGKVTRTIPSHAAPLLGILLIVIFWLGFIDRQIEFQANALDETFCAAVSFQNRDVTYEVSRYYPKPGPRKLPFAYTEILELSVAYRIWFPDTTKKVLGVHLESHSDSTTENLSAKCADWYPIAGLAIVFWWMRRRTAKTQSAGFPVTVSPVSPANRPALST